MFIVHIIIQVINICMFLLSVLMSGICGAINRLIIETNCRQNSVYNAVWITIGTWTSILKVTAASISNTTRNAYGCTAMSNACIRQA